MRTFSLKYQFWEMHNFLGAFGVIMNFGVAFCIFSYYPICEVFLLIQNARGKKSILMEHVVLNCGLNPSVRNSARSITHSAWSQLRNI